MARCGLNLVVRRPRTVGVRLVQHDGRRTHVVRAHDARIQRREIQARYAVLEVGAHDRRQYRCTNVPIASHILFAVVNDVPLSSRVTQNQGITSDLLAPQIEKVDRHTHHLAHLNLVGQRRQL